MRQFHIPLNSVFNKKNSIFLICFALFPLSSCNYTYQDSVGIGQTQNPGNGDQPGSSKALPEFSSNELKLRALEELMRVYTTASYLVAPPAKPDLQIGCRSIRHFANEPSVRIIYNCKWNQSMGDQDFQWNLRDQENYWFPDSGPVRAFADLKIQASRPKIAEKKAAAIFLTRYIRNVTLGSGPNKRNLNSKIAIGNYNEKDADYWEAKIDGTVSTQTSPIALQVNEFQFGYRPAASNDKNVSVKVIQFTPIGKITFKGSGLCLRPHGAFNWKTTLGGEFESAGRIDVDQSGITDLQDGKTESVPWSTSCMEFTD